LEEEGSRSRAGWRRWVAEFVLIVAGVSVALGADSLWEYRQDRVREREHLARLREDLQENARRLREAIAVEERQREAAIRAFEAVARGERVTPDSARSWLLERRGLYYTDPRLLTGSFTALVSTGELRLVRDSRVRQAVVGYVPKISADKSEFDRWVERLVEYNAELRRVGLASGDRPEESIERVASYTGEAREDPSIFALTATARSPQVLTSLDGVLFTGLARITYLRFMLDATTELSVLLEGT
jgi:hypothetical protein